MEDGLDMYANDDAYRAGLDSNTAVQSLEEAEAVSREQILSLCRDVPAECAEDGILRILYGFITDSEKRNAEGLAPLMAKVDRVKAAAGPGPAIRRRGRRFHELVHRPPARRGVRRRVVRVRDRV